MINFGYTIVYVPDVEQTINFYENVFDLKRKFIHESGQYGELETGATTLAFASNDLARTTLGSHADFHPNTVEKPPAGIEIALVTDQVESYFTKAVQQGAVAIAAPTKKPWGQMVGYIRDLNGVLIEIASPMQS